MLVIKQPVTKDFLVVKCAQNCAQLCLIVCLTQYGQIVTQYAEIVLE